MESINESLGVVTDALFVDVSWSFLGLTWSQGGYNVNSGQAISSTTSIRLGLPHDIFSKINSIKCNEGYTISILGFDTNGYIGMWKNGEAFSKSVSTGNFKYSEIDMALFDNLDKISLRANRTDGGDIIPSEAVNIVPFVNANNSVFIIDNTLSETDKAADAYETGFRFNKITNDIYKTYRLSDMSDVTIKNGAWKANDGTANTVTSALRTGYLPEHIKELHLSAESVENGYYMRLYGYSDDVYQGCLNSSKTSFIKSGSFGQLSDIVFSDFDTFGYDYKIVLTNPSLEGGIPSNSMDLILALCVDYKVTLISADEERPADYQGREICTFNKMLCIGDSLMTGSTNHPTGITPNQSNATREVQNSMYSIPTFLTKMYGIQTTAWGISGATTRSWYNGRSSDDWSGYDAALIRLGNNDYTYGTSDNVDYDGAADLSEQYMRLIIAKLKADNPGIRIFLSTLSVSNVTGRLAEWRNPMMDRFRQIAAEDNSVFLVDTAIYANYRATGGYYSGHPTALGYQLMAQDYGSIISYIMHNNPDSFKWIQTVGTAYAVTDYSEAGDEEDVG